MHKPAALITFRRKNLHFNIYLQIIGLTPAGGGQFLSAIGGQGRRLLQLITVSLNIVMGIFTSFVLLTDGIPKEVAYIILTLLLLFVPIFNLVIILRNRADNSWLDFHLKMELLKKQTKPDELHSKIRILKIVAIICNIVLSGFVCYAFVNQYSQHPKESGFILYAVIVFLTPILSLMKFAFYKQ